MRPHRAYVPELKGEGEEVLITGPEAEHLLKVLRARVGDRFWAFDGRGVEGELVLTAAGPGWLRARVLKTQPVEREPEAEITLYLALLKGEKLAEVVRMGTELGVSEFVLVVTRHAVAKEIGEKKLARLRRIAIEAAKQSGRTRVPEVKGPIPLKEIPAVEQGLVAHPGTGRLVAEVYDPSRPVALAVGPEGGFSEEEVALLTARGFVPVTLGRRILKAETAACTLVALVTAAYGR